MQNEKPKIGLFGTSGNPTHKGHMAAMRAAKVTLGLDAIWMLINPFNPLKDPSIYADYVHRKHLAQLEVDDSPDLKEFITVNDFEKEMRDQGVANDTITTLQMFERQFPQYEPVWLMGADSFATIHTWGGNWNHILERYHVAVFSREGDNEEAEQSVSARAYREQQVDPQRLLTAPRGHWTFIDSVSHSASSTKIREHVYDTQAPDHISAASREYIVRNGLYVPK